MHSYHGASTAVATTLVAGRVDVTLGGGELGRGFYSGQYLHEAKAWAYQVSGDKRNNVVEFDASDDAVEELDMLMMDYGTAALRRHAIRQQGAMRTHLFEVDLVWAPVVGSERVSGDQYKWESDRAGSLLNAEETARRIL